MSELVLKIDHILIRELMENDPNFAVEVKKGILRSAIKHYTASIWENAATAETRKMIKEEIGDYVGTWSPTVTISPRLIKKINEKLNPQVEAIADKLSTELTENISKKVEDITQQKIMYFLSEQVERELEKIISTKLKAVIDKLIAETLKNTFDAIKEN